MKRAVDWYCSRCGTELSLSVNIGRRNKRKLYCLKCAKEIKNEK